VTERPYSMTLADAVRYTGVSERTIRDATKSGALSARYVGRKPLYRSADLDSWVDSMPQEAPTRRSA